MMKITPLQHLLLTQNKPLGDVRQAVGVGRAVLWNWKKGRAFPNQLNMKKLIDLYGPEQLDYNGCFIASVEITDEQARLYGLNHTEG
jgi:hypothetical protein